MLSKIQNDLKRARRNEHSEVEDVRQTKVSKTIASNSDVSTKYRLLSPRQTSTTSASIGPNLLQGPSLTPIVSSKIKESSVVKPAKISRGKVCF